jgi:hypothetical protein
MTPGRARMIESIDQLTGTRDCTEALLVQSRPTWALPMLVAVVGCTRRWIRGGGGRRR